MEKLPARDALAQRVLVAAPQYEFQLRNANPHDHLEPHAQRDGRAPHLKAWAGKTLPPASGAASSALIVRRNEPLLRARMAGADWHWLRYPFLDEGTPAKRDTVRLQPDQGRMHVFSNKTGARLT